MKPALVKVLRVTAVLSSASLLGVYVSCRANSRKASPAVVAEPTPPAPETAPPTTPEHNRDVFVGTKSAEIFPTPKEESRPTMPGSKSPFRVWPPEGESPKQPAPAQPQSPK